MIAFYENTMKPFLKIYENVSQKLFTGTCHNADEVRRLVTSLPKVHDRIDASYNRYRCRREALNVWERILFNFSAAAILAITIPRVVASRRSSGGAQNQKLVIEKRTNTPCFGIVPDELVNKYDETEYIEQVSPKIGALCTEARKVYVEAGLAHPFRFYYLLLVLKELSIHSHILLQHNPKAVAVYDNERNVASPLITELYERSERHFIGFMHGDYPINPLQACMEYSTYYAWDQYYVDMFVQDLLCNPDQFEVYTPPRLTKKWNCEAVKPHFFLTYYFSGEKEQSVQVIANIFERVQKSGKSCKVRPHPRHSNSALIHRVFKGIYIESPDTMSMRQSLEATECAVGLFSTALSEAFVEGRRVVIDDISDPGAYKNLKSGKSIMLARPHALLSELVANIPVASASNANNLNDGQSRAVALSRTRHKKD